jgi:hypothetical protein
MDLIVLFRGYCDHSNRLFQNVHFEAFCLEHGIAYSNPTLHDLRAYYVVPAGSQKRFTAWVLRSKVVAALRRLGLLPNVITFATESDNARLMSKAGRRTLYVDGWAFRVHDLTKKYRERLAAGYALKEEYLRGNETLGRMMAVDRGRYVLAAVHVRRGDYRRWSGGAYYFSDDVYRLYMRAMETRVRATYGNGVVFVVFSADETSFVDGEDLVVSKNPWYVDHYLMSQCDYIIGPPSTFSMWASYMGGAKYLHITDASGRIDLDRFAVCTG